MPRSITNRSKEFHKLIRNLLDTKRYDEIFKSIRDFNGSGGIPTVDTISNVLANADKIVSDSFQTNLDYLLKFINEKDYTELTFTSLIRLFSLSEFQDFDKIYYYYNLMKHNSVIIKRRTLSPIFENLNSWEHIIYFYTDSKIQNIVLSLDDYINILTNEITPMYSDIIITDMVNTIDKFIPEEYLEKINTIFKTKYPSIIDSKTILQKYTLPQKDADKLLERMKIYISHFYSKKTHILEKVNSSMKTLKKLKYDIVIDGANVGFYKRGTLSGIKVSIKQIFDLVSLFVSHGKKVLIIIHNHHIESASSDEKKILENIYSNPITNIFIVPKGSDDDWFWLFASLSNPKSYLVTNDEMRNHLYYMNLDKSFQYWKETRVINYDLTHTMNFSIKEPYPYLKKIQLNIKNREIIIPFFNKDKNIEWESFQF
tara:strand:+ start:3279 stop:4562 length:1284 start_codon:yes stop_codon:yes gene_type:complete